MSYLEEQGIGQYLRDALYQIGQLRRRRPPLSTKRPATPKESINIAQFLADYCRSIQHGTHLYKREMSYVMMTVRNRLGFVRLVERAFLPGLVDCELDGGDLQAFLELICPDFKISYTQDAVGLLKTGDTSNIENLLATLRFRLLFTEFWEMSRKALTRPTIVLPNAQEDDTVMKSNPDFESSLCNLCAKLRDSNQPSPKIFSIKASFAAMPPAGIKTGEDVHHFITRQLCHDVKVIALIDSYDKF